MTVLSFQTRETDRALKFGQDFARRFDHTNLKPVSTEADIVTLCEEAVAYNFAAVCIAPRWVEVAASMLGKSNVNVCTVVGFPHGNTTTKTKTMEAAEALGAGANEIDMVMSIGDFKAGAFDIVERDIASVVSAAHGASAIVKVILETGYLDDAEIATACDIAVHAGADFVKSSTGFGPSGASPEVIRLMRETVGAEVGVKAAGGIRTLDDAKAMLRAGASRLGCSGSVKIIEELALEKA